VLSIKSIVPAFFAIILNFFRILNIHKYVRDIYLPKFPELENLILNPLEYVKVVMLIKNETVSLLLDALLNQWPRI